MFDNAFLYAVSLISIPCQYSNAQLRDTYVTTRPEPQPSSINGFLQFSNWFNELIDSYAKTITQFCLTNAAAEANDNNIQTLVDVGYGYGNFPRLRNRILYINRSYEIKGGVIFACPP